MAEGPRIEVWLKALEDRYLWLKALKKGWQKALEKCE